jgi:hypothetical protein
VVRTRTPAADPNRDEVDVFATGTTVIVEPAAHEPSGAPVGEQLRRAATALHTGLDHARRLHARSGPRIGAGPATVASAREGTRTEIVRPVLLDPWLAWELAGSGRLFADPIPHLRVGEPRAETPQPAWAASLRTGRLKRRAAELHVTASPSFNVTVLELVPASRRRTGARSFLRAGLQAVEELAHRLEATRTA